MLLIELPLTPLGNQYREICWRFRSTRTCSVRFICIFYLIVFSVVYFFFSYLSFCCEISLGLFVGFIYGSYWYEVAGSTGVEMM